MVHFNDVLEVTATTFLGEIIYLITCLQGNWKSVPEQGCILYWPIVKNRAHKYCHALLAPSKDKART